MNNEMVTVIIKAVIMVVSVVVSSYLIPYIKNKLGENKFAELQEYVEYAVRCAEMIYTPDEWQEKKKYVSNYICDKANELGIYLTAKDIDTIIEAFVHLVKHNDDYAKA